MGFTQSSHAVTLQELWTKSQETYTNLKNTAEQVKTKLNLICTPLALIVFTGAAYQSFTDMMTTINDYQTIGLQGQPIFSIRNIDTSLNNIKNLPQGVIKPIVETTIGTMAASQSLIKLLDLIYQKNNTTN